jgi:membrane-bound lytic murein transglycosylase D
MKSSLAKIILTVLLAVVTACSLPLQNGSPKIEDTAEIKAVDKVAPLPQREEHPEPYRARESQASAPREDARPRHEVVPPASSERVIVKPETNPVQNSERLLDEALESFQRSQVFWRKGDFGKAVAALDQAYRLILQVDPKGDGELAQQKEAIRLMICKRGVEIYATQHTTANGSEKAIPLIMNHYVQREINLFKGPERKFFLDGYKRSGRYRPMIVAALEKAGLPKELSWLPLIESGFRAEAFSRARALGLWQFIPSTGYKFGLKRDKWLDERMDAEKSTRAAIAYLKDLHNIFGDWCTVLAAYNCGEARVLDVIRTQRVNYLDNFWDLFAKLPQETARYVPRFIATLHILNNPEAFGFNLEEIHPPIPFQAVKTYKQVLLKDVAKTLGASPETMEALNPELRFKLTPPGPYDLKVPEGKADLLLAKLSEIPASKLIQKRYVSHPVQKGETLNSLARRYHTNTKVICELNQIKEKQVLRVGQRLKVPAGGPVAGKETEAEPEITPAADPEPLRHRVKRGDTLWKIVQQYKTSLDETMRLNRLETTHLRTGQELLIPPGK